MRVWIDIENPPQVQYLVPFKPAFERLGVEVVLTARDYGNAFELLDQAGIPYAAVGSSYGSGKLQKVLGLAGRSRQLLAHFRRVGRPDASISASRAAAAVCRLIRRPSFVILDYEHVSLGAFRLAGSSIFHPEVIPTVAFAGRGIRADRLLPFSGLKEDISFSDVDIAATPAHRIQAPDGLVRALLRPAAEESHYYREESGRITTELLERLAGEERTVLVFSPRYPRQVEYLARFTWRNEPVILDHAVPFVSLLKGIDLVISSGGTMLREAAYLGIPAYSLFQGELGGVDRHLVELGRLRLLTGPEDFEQIALTKASPPTPLATNPRLVDEVAQRVVRAVATTSPDG
jgi:predicted glycosyltransferase